MHVQATQRCVRLQSAQLLKSIALEVESLKLWELLHASDSMEAYNKDKESKYQAKYSRNFQIEVHMGVVKLTFKV